MRASGAELQLIAARALYGAGFLFDLLIYTHYGIRRDPERERKGMKHTEDIWSTSSLPDVNMSEQEDVHYPPTVIHSSWETGNFERLLGMLVVRMHCGSHQAYHIAAEPTHRRKNEMVITKSAVSKYVGYTFIRQPKELDEGPVDLITHNDLEVSERR